MLYQRERLYKRLKKADNGRLIVEYWKGAEKFLGAVPGIDWEKQGNRILIKEESIKMKTFRQILDEEKLQEGTWNLPFKVAQAKKLAALMKKPVPTGPAGTKMLSGLIGDDDLFDDIEGASPLDTAGKDDARDLIRDWLVDILIGVKKEPDRFGELPEPAALKILQKIRLSKQY